MEQKNTKRAKPITISRSIAALSICLCTLFIVPTERIYAASDALYETKHVDQQITVKGKVVDEYGDPLPGATVRAKDEKTGTITDIDGNFAVTVKSKSTMLVISFIGFTPQEVKASGDLSKIVLSEESEKLDEVVVTGYQTIDRRLFAGSADLIKAEDSKIDGVTDVSRMLQGKAAGVQVQNVSGTFGAAPKIRVRGASSIYGDSKPLWVVDGVVLEDVVEVSADDLSSGNATTLISSAVAGLNADDIESFQILKDASATALYGARAMNGVVVITTKKGRKGSTHVNYTGEFTIRTKPNYGEYNIMNSQEQMMVFQDLEKKGWLNHADLSTNAAGGIYLNMYDLMNQYDPKTGSFGMPNTPIAKAKYLRKAELANTNWFDKLFKNSIQQNHALSIAGGNEKSRYYGSLSYFTDPGWSISDKVERFTANFNTTVDITSKVTLGLLTSSSLRKQTVPGTMDRQTDVVNGEFNRDFDINPFSYALNSSRTLVPYDDEGNYQFYKMNYAPFNIMHEANNNKLDIDMLDTKFQAELAIKPIQGLELRSIASLRYVKSTNEHKIYESSNLAEAYRAAQNSTIRKYNKFLWKNPDNPADEPIVVMPKGGFYNREDNKMLTYYLRNTASYNNYFNEKHGLTAMLGQEIKSTDRTASHNDGYGYQWNRGGIPFVDYRLMRQVLDGGFNYYGMGRQYDRFVAFFLNAGYSFDERYTVNATGRYDGSNRMGKSSSSRWLPTWNVSGAWNAHNEKFMQNQKVISTLKLRATYGLTATMGPASNARAIFLNDVTFRPYQDEKESQIYISSLENSDLTWEKQYEFNFGFDVGFLNNRISLSLDAYKRKGFDLIDLVRTSGIGGEQIKWANHADMDSKGIEFTLNTRNLATSDFSWTTNATFSYNTNEIKKLKSRPNVMRLVREEGGPLEGYPVGGLFSIPFAGLSEEGLPTFYWHEGEIIDGDVNFQESQDVSFLKFEGSVDPKIVGGMENSFKYKDFRLGVYFTYQFGNKIRLYPSFSATYSDMEAMPIELRDRWMMRGDEAKTNVPAIPSRRQYYYHDGLYSAYNAYNYSDQRIARGDFIRLKEITLSYTIPKMWLKPLSLSNAELRFVASNLALLYRDKKLNGQDPEFFRAGGVAMPMPKQFTFTLRVGL